MAESKILIRSTDAEKLWRLLETAGVPDDVDGETTLEAELARAQVVADEALPEGVVTMDATVVFENQDGRRREVTLVYPESADAARGRISVLSPIGSALLGLTRGGEIDWPLPRGKVARLRVIDVRPAAGN
jgi:regulator of nucleoside diphosphate kinase